MAEYIPTTDEGFDGFQRNFMTIIVAIAVAAGIPASAITALQALQTTWTNAFAVGGYAQRTTRTSVQTRTKTEARKAYVRSNSPQPLGLRAFIQAWVMYNPLISVAQHISLGVPVHKTTRTQHKVATKNLVVFKSKGLGGGVVQTDCHSSGSNILNPTAATAKKGKKGGRDKKEPGYDILKSWKIVARGAALPATANDAGMTKTLFTKAKIIQQLGPENEGLILCEFLQWYIPKHPELAGPWSDLQTTIIT